MCGREESECDGEQRERPSRQTPVSREVRLVGTPIPPWLQRKMKMECLHAARELVKLLVTHSSDKKHTIRGGNVLW